MSNFFTFYIHSIISFFQLNRPTSRYIPFDALVTGTDKFKVIVSGSRLTNNFAFDIVMIIIILYIITCNIQQSITRMFINQFKVLT